MRKDNKYLKVTWKEGSFENPVVNEVIDIHKCELQITNPN